MDDLITNRSQDDWVTASAPLAMAYVRMQPWQRLYDPDAAFDRATLFQELDKPFTGERVR